MNFQLHGRVNPGVEAAITFHPWFYFQENLVWIEHGHQYDRFCSFDHFTVPVEPEREEIVLSLGAASYRYVANQTSAMIQQTIAGELTLERWGQICYQ